MGPFVRILKLYIPCKHQHDLLETAEIDVEHTGMFGTPHLILRSNLTLQIIKVASTKDVQSLYRTPAVANAYIPTAVRPSTGLNNELATPITAPAAEVSSAALATPPGTKPAMLYTKAVRGLNKGRTSPRTVAISGAINVMASVKDCPSA
jgi:hypothetical protein